MATDVVVWVCTCVCVCLCVHVHVFVRVHPPHTLLAFSFMAGLNRSMHFRMNPLAQATVPTMVRLGKDLEYF